MIQNNPTENQGARRHLRVMMDASSGGSWVRIDCIRRDLRWTKGRVALAAAWRKEVWEFQVHRELAAMEELLWRARDDGQLCGLLEGQRVLWWQDCIGAFNVYSEQ